MLLPWPPQRSQEGKQELESGVEGARSKDDRARGLQGRILHRGWGLRCAHRCPPAPWEQEMALEEQEVPGPLGAGWASRGVPACGARERCSWGCG